MLKLKNISKSYGSDGSLVKALREVDFELVENEFVAIMGKSGCGKTTLINVLAALIKPDEGSYWFGSEDVCLMSEKQRAEFRRRNVSVIFQNYNLVEELNGVNNIILPYVFEHRKHDAGQLEKIADDLGISHVLKKLPSEMSGGEKQRIAIARTLLLRPQVILADEPTGNLDKENAIRIMDVLRMCRDKYGQAIVLVTHDRDMAEYADRIISMSDGRIMG